ncbi:uncharacterized protein PAC_04111 [Phialocephala subalpina]|uniref:Uncharacterized protein n=1 Tax=Phialocephala subalpina TaxID=576137 RepID=A0A1L7WN93_9HELO|nr:uncharacterized protein PAC_04111 [Phialocephala subalpina]
MSILPSKILVDDFKKDVLVNRVWVDYDRSLLLGPRILVPEWWAFFWVSLFAVWITLWAPQYWKLIQRIVLPLIEAYCKRRAQKANVTGHFDDMMGDGWEDDIALRTLVGGRYEEAITNIREARTADEASALLFRLLISNITSSPIHLPGDHSNTRKPLLTRARLKCKTWVQNLRTEGLTIIITVLAFFLCGFIFALIAAAGTAVVYLELDSNGISTSPSCGLWWPPDDGSADAEKFYRELGRTEEAVEAYYRSCYEQESSLQDCAIFPHRDLYSTITEHNDCPFRNQSMCLPGKNLVITLDTGYVDSKYVGISSAHRPFFRRRTICSPLVSDGFVKIKSFLLGSMNSTRFFYGRDDFSSKRYGDDNRTFTQVKIGSPIYGYVPGGYTVTTRTEIGDHQLGYHPIEGLTSSKGVTTLIFIIAENLQYSKASEDPIFPAKRRTRIEECSSASETETCWKDDSIHATALGCVESAEVCSEPKSDCLEAYGPRRSLVPQSWSSVEESILLFNGIKLSSLSFALQTRGAYLLMPHGESSMEARLFRWRRTNGNWKCGGFST